MRFDSQMQIQERPPAGDGLHKYVEAPGYIIVFLSFPFLLPSVHLRRQALGQIAGADPITLMQLVCL